MGNEFGVPMIAVAKINRKTWFPCTYTLTLMVYIDQDRSAVVVLVLLSCKLPGLGTWDLSAEIGQLKPHPNVN